MKSIFSVALAVLLAIAGSAQTFPEASIANGLIRARLYLPDTATGYYRSTRFDWSGVMPSLEYKGHSFFGQWFPRYAPTINDAIMGPVESFWPLDFDRASAGGAFTVIGVGVLTRPDSNRYSPFRYYPIRDAGTWRVSTTKAAIEFQQTLHGQAYNYVYTKNVSLVKDRPELVITHALRNTGSQPISTEVFDHNFFVTDSTDLAPGIVLKFPFPLSADGMTGPTDLAAIGGDSISLLRPFAPRESVYAVLHGYGDSPRDYDIRLENHLTGAGVHITADKPFSKLVYWGSIHTLCPEPYIHVSVAPGETFNWTLRYEFYTLNNRP
jgi:hypothetical protein